MKEEREHFFSKKPLSQLVPCLLGFAQLLMTIQDSKSCSDLSDSDKLWAVTSTFTTLCERA